MTAKVPAVFKSKTLWISLSALLGLTVAVRVGVPPLLQSQVPSWLAKKSGHTLTFGTPEIDYFNLNVVLPDLELLTPEGEPLAAFDRLRVDVDGTRLWRGVVELDAIDLDGLDVQLVLKPDGTLNWTPLIQAFADPEPKPDTPPPNVVLGHVNLRQASITVQDQRLQKPFEATFKDLDLTLNNVATRSTEAGDFKLHATTSFGADLALQAKLRLQDLAVDGTVDVSGLQLAALAPVIQPLTHTGTPTGLLQASTHFEVAMPQGQAQVQLSKLQAELSQFAIASAHNAAPSAAPAKVQLANLKVEDGSVNLTDTTLELPRITLQGLGLHEGAQKTPVQLANLQVGNVQVNWGKQNALVDSVQLGGGQIKLLKDVQGPLNLEAFAAHWTPPQTQEAPAATDKDTPKAPWTFAIKQLGLNDFAVDYADNSIKPGFEVGLSKLNIKTQNLTEQLSKPLQVNVSSEIKQGGKLEAVADLVPETAKGKVKVNLQDLNLGLANLWIGDFAKLKLSSGTLSSQGEVSLQGPDVAYKGGFDLSNLKLTDTTTNKPFLVFKRLGAPSLTANPKALNIGRLNLDGLDTQFLIAKDKSTNVSRILVTQAAPESKNATIDKNDQQKGTSNASNKKTGTDAANATKNEQSDFAINIARFAISNSEMDFADESLFLPFGTRIHNLNGSVNGISMSKNTQSVVELKGEVDNYGEANAKGTVNLLDPTQHLNMAVRFNNVEMTSLTPYSATFANRKIKSGKLSLALDYNIQNQQLNSNNKVLIDKLVLGEKVQSPQATDLPLDLAIALLEDADGKIDLGLPITGSLTDPQFSYGAVLWKALGNLVTKAVTAPFRALAGIFGGSEESLGTIVFEAGAPALSPPQREQLGKIAQALQKRPNLQVQISGPYTDADRTALQALQLRRAVALQLGEKLGPAEDPGPLALQSAPTIKAMETLLDKRLGGAELAALKAGYKQTNPGQLQESLAGQALGQLGSLIKTPRTLSAAELAALKGKPWPQVLATRLQATEVVSPAQLQTLAQQRQDQALTLLRGQVPEGDKRVLAGKPQQVTAGDDNNAPLQLEVMAKP